MGCFNKKTSILKKRLNTIENHWKLKSNKGKHKQENGQQV